MSQNPAKPDPPVQQTEGPTDDGGSPVGRRITVCSSSKSTSSELARHSGVGSRGRTSAFRPRGRGNRSVKAPSAPPWPPACPRARREPARSRRHLRTPPLPAVPPAPASPPAPAAPSVVEPLHPAKGRTSNANTLTQLQIMYLITTSRIQGPTEREAMAVPGDSAVLSVAAPSHGAGLARCAERAPKKRRADRQLGAATDSQARADSAAGVPSA